LVFAAGVPAASAQSGPQVIGVFGKAGDLIVHAWVVVPVGENASDVAREALANQGARPFTSAEFTATGLVWSQIVNGTGPIVQNYNPANDPTGNGQAALLASHATWNAVADPNFVISDEDTTNRCPSLVKECRRAQFEDGLNDVAWMNLGGCCTLGVTWFTTATEEADMALNTRFDWNGTYDAETVFLHEGGHVAGLGHSQVQLAVMFASYQGVRTVLQQDDIDGLVALYPAVPPEPPTTGSISGTGTDSETGQPIAGATVTTDTGQSGDTDGLGAYTLSDVPTGERTVTASASGYGSENGAVTVAENETVTADFGLTAVPVGSTVSVNSVTYATEGGRRGDKHLLITVALADDVGNPVSGASVSIELSRNGSLDAAGTGTTGSDGTVTFSRKNARSGDYDTEVKGVTAADLTWDGITPVNAFTK
jgi:hypothetical protein